MRKLSKIIISISIILTTFHHVKNLHPTNIHYHNHPETNYNGIYYKQLKLKCINCKATFWEVLPHEYDPILQKYVCIVPIPLYCKKCRGESINM